ncbi:GAF domain-containing protein [Streptomyces sp. NPDC002851]
MGHTAGGPDVYGQPDALGPPDGPDAPDGPGAPDTPDAPDAPDVHHSQPGAHDQPAVALRQLLDLLARSAPAEEFARPAAQARAEGAGPDAQVLVDEATEVALGIRRTLAQHRRRETELAALFDTASDLAALRDLDAVLRAIVHRARTLLGTDVAYLTLNDPAGGDTFMRVTDGSVSAAFQQLRLGMGEGLGGLVAQTARPYASTDYRVDDRFTHTAAIDHGVGEEGLRGILGVPMRVGTEVIGVLYAADRSPRTFTPDAVALLSSLADHAAIAIDNARLLEETRATLTELNAATETARAHSRALHRAAETHDRLTELVLRGGTVTDVAGEIAALLGGGVAVHDADGTELARPGTETESPHAGSETGPPPEEAVRASRATGQAVAADGAWICAALAGPELLGTLTLTGRTDLSEVDRRLLERAGLVTALLLLLRRSVAEAEDRVRGELLSDLLAADHRQVGPPCAGQRNSALPLHADPVDPDRRHADSLALRARKLGVHLGRPHAVLVLDCAAEHRPRLYAEVTRYARGHGGLAGPHHGHTVLIVPTGTDHPGRRARQLAAELGRLLDTPVTVGAAGPAKSPDRLPATHAEALRCLRALHTLGRTGSGARLPDLGFIGVLLGDRADIHGYIEDVLGPVLSYDARRGTELTRTLHAFYAHGGSLAKAKDALHVHVNTVVQRLDRVRRLLGDDWNSPSHALELQLALRLHDLSMGSPPNDDHPGPA